MSAECIVRLDINPKEAMKYYRGEASIVIASDLNGRRIQFPASAIRSLIGESGLHGYYKILYDDNNKLIGIERANL